MHIVFSKFIEENQLVRTGEKVLLAVSGGMDSMCMLHLFHQSGYNFQIAHCNFQLRGKHSDEDEALLRDTAKKLKLKLHIKKFNTEEISKKRGTSIQLTARNLRYEYFSEICNKEGLDKIATAHHLNDSIESFFINLNRGTGISGLKGIPLINNNIIRPINAFSKSEIEAFVMHNHIPYREDKSNRENKYLRNWFRNVLLELWKKRNPQFESVMKSNLQLISRQEQLYKKFIRSSLLEVQAQLQEGSIDINKLLKLEDPEIMLFEIFHEYGFSYSDMKQFLQLLKNPHSGKSIQSEQYTLFIDRKKVFLKKNQKESTKEYCIENVDDVKHLPMDLHMEVKKYRSDILDPSPLLFQADMESIEFPLKLRKWQAGDAFIPFGMKGRKKISDYLIDKKIPLVDKENVYVLLSNKKLIWLLGYRADECIRITSNTKEILQIKWNKA